jgi:glycerol-1-phosphate dehydrogenase [NAD(P)+]
MPSIWNLPKINITSLNQIQEERPTALITNPATWENLQSVLNLPIVVQAEPTVNDLAAFNSLAEHLPNTVKVIYVVGTGLPLTAGKLVAGYHNLPLVVVPDALESDELVEAHVFLPREGKLNSITTGPAYEVMIDWDVIQAATPDRRATAIVDVLAIVTALLDWRYAARLGKNPPEQRFSAWGASVAASLASQAIKSAEAIGQGSPEALRTLLDLLMVSVQLAHQLGHDRHQEGTEHYFAFSMANQGIPVSHAKAVGAGILFASALHGQDPTSLSEALQKAGIEVDKINARDIRRAIGDLPDFCVANDLPFGRSHDLDPFSDEVGEALERARLLNYVEEGAPLISSPEVDELEAFEGLYGSGPAVKPVAMMTPAPSATPTPAVEAELDEAARVNDALASIADDLSGTETEATPDTEDIIEDSFAALVDDTNLDTAEFEDILPASAEETLDFASLLEDDDMEMDLGDLFADDSLKTPPADSSFATPTIDDGDNTPDFS